MSKKIKRYAILFILALMSAVFLFPLIVTFTNSFMTETEIAMNYTTKRDIFDILDGIYEKFVVFRLIPKNFTLRQYSTVLIDQPSFLVLMTNSVKLTVPVVFFNLLVSILAAYGFTVWQWKHKETVFFVYIVVMLMPLQAVLVPNYIVADRLGFLENNAYLAIIMPGIFQPFGTFLLRQTMKAIPEACFEAARLDGASDTSVFLHMVIPQMKSGISALVMLTFIEYWNIVEQSVVFIKDYYREPLSVYLSRLAEGRIGLIFAASCVYMYTPFLFLIFGQKDLEKGIELSGIK